MACRHSVNMLLFSNHNNLIRPQVSPILVFIPDGLKRVVSLELVKIALRIGTVLRLTTNCFIETNLFFCANGYRSNRKSKLSHFLYKFNRSQDPHLLCLDLVPSVGKFQKAREGDFGVEPSHLERCSKLLEWRATEALMHVSSNTHQAYLDTKELTRVLKTTSTLEKLDMAGMNLNDCIFKIIFLI